MGFVLSARSEKALVGVDPKLIAVVRRAIKLTERDFMVMEGVRSREQCMINYGKGRTVNQVAAKGIPASYAKPKALKVTWLNNPFASKHCTGDAVDLLPAPYDWQDIWKFDEVAKAMFASAKELDVQIRWGRDWDGDGKFGEQGEADAPHFELA